MFKFFYVIFFSFSILHAAALEAVHIDDLKTPIVLERPGLYSLTFSLEIKEQILATLESILGKEHASHQVISAFFESCVYPHPHKVTYVRPLWKKFKQIVDVLRKLPGVKDPALPYFSTLEYGDPTSHTDAIAAFGAYLREKLGILKDFDLTSKLTLLHQEADDCLNQYRDFYRNRQSPLQSYEIERYLINLLHICTSQDRHLTKDNELVLSILVSSGMLQLGEPLINGVYEYSPKAMVGAYIKAHSDPKTIILGCGHASSLPFLTSLGLKQAVWCDGGCENRPHSGAMVISLDEPSADILCDLNHPGLWEGLSDASIDLVADETRYPDCYALQTFDSIARVLKVGGEFHSNGYAAGCPLTAELLKRGFVVAEENLESNTIKLSKVR
jgi:hypothetical protein